jgi:DNA adenine methylase
MPALVRRAPRHDAAVQPLSPPLKWAGGKRWQVPLLKPLWEAHAQRRLVEPFCGGLATALGLLPRRALLNDLNPHVINFYRWLKRGLRVSVAMENSAETFYAHRSRFNGLVRRGRERTREAASLFYYLNRTAYNGLCRFNASGEFNVPYGRYANIRYVADFSAYRETLASWTFTVGDFTDVPIAPADFVYADPPYDVEFTKYAKQGFTWRDQVRAAEWCAAHAGPVVLVNEATDRICRLYTTLGFRLEFLTAPRRISCTGDRTPTREVLALRNL